MEYVSPEGLRLDGRRDKELRKLNATIGVLQSADGSATFEMGNTKVRMHSPCQIMLAALNTPQSGAFDAIFIIYFLLGMAGDGCRIWPQGGGAAVALGR